MTVGTNVKRCFFSIKSAEATLEQFILKTNIAETKQAYKQARQILTEVKTDLEKQVIFLAKEEQQYK